MSVLKTSEKVLKLSVNWPALACFFCVAFFFTQRTFLLTNTLMDISSCVLLRKCLMFALSDLVFCSLYSYIAAIALQPTCMPW